MRTFLTLLLITSSATAAPVTWTIDSMSFYFTGGRAYGSFDYDASTNQFSNINITTTHADGREYITYQYLNPGGLDPASATNLPAVASSQADLTGVPGLEFGFASALTNAGGTVAITGGYEAYCDNSVCDWYDYDWPWREIISGSVSAVPVPGAVWLLGSALAGLGWFRRKQSH